MPQTDVDNEEKMADEILVALRRVSRAIDLHSRRLASDHALTGPQLVVLRQLRALEESTPSHLAQTVSLSHATVTGIISRLMARQLVTRTPDTKDRRRVLLRLTDEGEAMVSSAPYPLQEKFVKELAALPRANQVLISVVLEQIVEMMGADSIDAAPVLTTGPITAPAAAVEDLLESPTTADDS